MDINVEIRKEGNMFVCQCSPIDVCTQGKSIPQVLERLAWVIDAEINERGSIELIPRLEKKHIKC